jgi:SAM-dependent methyltransferase
MGAILDRLYRGRGRGFAQRLRRLTRPAWLGTIRRTRPLSRYWGSDRGSPVDRYYIEGFLQRHRADIRGRVLEVKEPLYTRRYGSGVTAGDVLDIDAGNPQATVVADLAAADGIPEGTYDCFVLTQTLQLVYEIRAAVAHAHRALRPGGVLLVTVPAASRIVDGTDHYGDFWRFTPASCKALFGEVFGAENVTVEAHGNVLATIAFLTGMAREELSARELDDGDPSFPLVLCVRAVRR